VTRSSGRPDTPTIIFVEPGRGATSSRCVAASRICAILVVALSIGGCTFVTSGPEAASSSPANPASAAVPASLGANLEAADVEAALNAAAAAGPARFQTAYKLTDRAGYVQTMSRSDGVIDLSASRGLAIKEDFPGLALSAKRELALVGNRVFSRSAQADGAWEDGYGGAGAFLGLDVSGASAMAVVRAALPATAMWVVVASEPSDPAGSIRVRPDLASASDVAVVIDAAGRLVTVSKPSKPTAAGGAVDVHELTLTEFGVSLKFDAPG
jgi:hypothetical protein